MNTPSGGIDSSLRQSLARIGMLMQSGRWQDAAAALEALRKRHPAVPEISRLSAVSAHKLGNDDQALTLLNKALASHPNPALIHLNRGSILRHAGQTAKARQAFAKAVAADAACEPALYNLGLLEQHDANPEAARAAIEKALELNPRRAESWLCLGHALKALGSIEASAAAYRDGLRIKPESGDLWWALANLKSVAFSDREFKQLAQVADRAVKRPHPAAHFAFARALEDRDQYAAAFKAYQKGNALQRQRVKFHRSDRAALAERIRKNFNSELFERFASEGNPSEAPIFIVSMPRSGSTLIEQALSSHPDVTGASELPDLGQIALSLMPGETPGKWSPEGISGIDGPKLLDAGNEYLARTERWQQTSRFTDKMPDNFQLVGLVQLLLPRARIIDCRRDPRDVGISCYRQLFNRGHQWAYDLDDIATQYRFYRDTMDHWDEVLPGRALRVQYEDLVEDFETELRRLLDYCGLDWNPACLDFASNTRAVRTASAGQVREPINRKGIGRWKRYADWLGEFSECAI